MSAVDLNLTKFETEKLFQRKRLFGFAIPAVILAYLTYIFFAFDIAGLAGRASPRAAPAAAELRRADPATDLACECDVADERVRAVAHAPPSDREWCPHLPMFQAFVDGFARGGAPPKAITRAPYLESAPIAYRSPSTIFPHRFLFFFLTLEALGKESCQRVTYLLLLPLSKNHYRRSIGERSRSRFK